MALVLKFDLLLLCIAQKTWIRTVCSHALLQEEELDTGRRKTTSKSDTSSGKFA
jgi:hypothetical protein